MKLTPNTDVITIKSSTLALNPFSRKDLCREIWISLYKSDGYVLVVLCFISFWLGREQGSFVSCMAGERIGYERFRGSSWVAEITAIVSIYPGESLGHLLNFSCRPCLPASWYTELWAGILRRLSSSWIDLFKKWKMCYLCFCFQKSTKERDSRTQLGLSQLGLVCDSGQVLAQHPAGTVTWTEESHSFAGWPCGCYLTSLGLSHFLRKIRTITELAS